MATINLGKIRLNWLGVYAAGTTYALNDAVYHNGDSYVCVAGSSQGVAPITSGVISANWNALSRGASTVLTTRGDIPYYGASGLTRLAAATAPGMVLAQGSSGDPVWTIPSGRVNSQPYTGVNSHVAGTMLARQSMGYIRGGMQVTPNGTHPGYGNMFFVTEDRKAIKAAGYQWHWNLGYNAMSDQFSTATYPGDRANQTQYCQFDTPLLDNEYFSHVVRNQASAVAVTTLGRVYFTGYNGYGQFGFGDTNSRFIFSASTFFGPGTSNTAVDVKIPKIYEGSDTTTCAFFVRTAEGKLFGAGYNGAGVLGQGDTTNRTSWVQIGASTLNAGGATVVDFQFSSKSSVSNSCLIAWNSANQYYGWGNINQSQLGLNTTTQQNSPQRLVQFESLITAGATPIDVIMHMGGNDNDRVTTLILMSDGKIYVTGRSYQGQLGLGGADSQNSDIWQAIINPAGKTFARLWSSGGSGTTLFALTTDGFLYAWGNNNQRHIADNTTSNRQSPTLCTMLPAGFQGNIDQVWAWGSCDTTPTAYTTVFVRTTTGRWASWGYANYGCITHSQIYTPNLWNGAMNPLEITGNLPNQGVGLINIVPSYITGGNSGVHLVYDDGRMFYIGYDPNQRNSGTHDGSNDQPYNYYPRQVIYT